jgi:hypothetical protein
MSYLIKVYHSFEKWKKSFQEFLDDISKTLSKNVFTLWVNYTKWEICYSLDTNKSTYAWFESQFYTHFNDFQITQDDKNIWNYEKSKTVIWEITLHNDWFYPFKIDDSDDTDFISNLFRTFENLDVINDKIWFFIELRPIENEKFSFFVKSKIQHRLLKQKFILKFYKYLFSHKTQKNWKSEWDKYFKSKLSKNLFYAKIYMVAQSQNKWLAESKIKSIFNNFLVFKNYPLNQFSIKIHKNVWQLLLDLKNFRSKIKNYVLDSKEVSSFFHFPKNPKTETSLFTVKSRKLALPVWVPSFDYTKDENNEVFAKEYPQDTNIIWISDYRSITVPIGIYDEDRLRHVYVVWKTGTWKSKFLLNLMINDIINGKWVGVIDPHGDAIEEIMTHIPESRKDDVIIFDPTDDQFPFCINPLDVKPEESKQILAKWFIDIFKKFFGSNWNPKLEHVLRMIFLALLDKPNSTLFDIIRALTDKDFRYEMIDAIEDDVVRNFRTNEFAWRSQQFNTEAIMPILNKVWQLLSIDIMKTIFASPENKLDLRKVMDERKILLIKLPKGKLQEEIMWFLWAMFVTKLFQTAIGRQSVDKNERVPFFLYVDEFQNFATDTFNEILSEARKYWLSLSVAHQFIRQIPKNISEALFGNVWTLISFRISSEDAEYMKQHFQPFLNWYDLANLNMREFYCKLLVKWQVKDPFSLKSCWTPDIKIKKYHIQKLYEISRSKYARSLEEAKKVVVEQQWDVMKTIEEFSEPII